MGKSGFHFTAPYKHHPELDATPPACFPPAQWEIWVAGEKRMARTHAYANEFDGFCAQCTPRYRDQMKACGQCQHPNVRFFPDEDDDLVGRRPLVDDFGNLCYPTASLKKGS
jgi:hypothetical protein